VFIYKIQNKINGKIYIGKTIHNIEIRFGQHIKASKNENNDSVLCRAIRKYGIQSFDISVIDVTDNKDVLNEKEKYWIKFYDSKANGYNMTHGGDGGDLTEHKKKFHHTEESKQKIKEKRKFQIFTEETRKKLSESHKGLLTGKKLSEEHKKKLSESHKGSRPWMKGKKFPYKPRKPRPDMIGENNPAKRPEVRKKLRENNAMKRPEVVEKLIKTKTGMKYKPETKPRKLRPPVTQRTKRLLSKKIKSYWENKRRVS
jgi:group I intron endonuclease